MLARHVVVMMLVGALCAGNATALPVIGDSLDGNPSAQALTADAWERTQMIRDGPVHTDAATTLGRASAAVAEVLECHMAIRVPVTLFGGTWMEGRTDAASFLLPRTLTYTTLEEVPMYKTVEQTRFVPTGPLQIPLPVSETVQRLVGTEWVEATATGEVLYAVDLAWSADRYDWERIDFDVYLGLVSGADFLDRDGTLERVCGDVVVHDEFPDFAAYDYDRVLIRFGNDDRAPSAWVTELLDLEVRLADDIDATTLPTWEGAYSFCPSSAGPAIDREAGALDARIENGELSIPARLASSGATGDDAGPGSGNEEASIQSGGFVLQGSASTLVAWAAAGAVLCAVMASGLYIASRKR